MTISDQKHEPIAVPVPIPGSGIGGDDENPLTEKLIATPVDVPAASGQAYVEVVAPATLPEGYTFEAEANGRTFTVTVPQGGVKEGAKFTVPYPSDQGYLSTVTASTNIPVGAWRDGLCDCFTHGICHPHLWNAWCCGGILAGQIMQRLKLTWLASPGTDAQTKSTFKILFGITVVYLIINSILQTMARQYTNDYSYSDWRYYNPSEDLPTAFYAFSIADQVIDLIYGLFLLVIVLKTRYYIRQKYSIPEKHCNGCEDCCCVFWCGCCTIAQMARHTADYETYSAQCCSETGLPSAAPSIV